MDVEGIELEIREITGTKTYIPFHLVVMDEIGQPFMVIPASHRHTREAVEEYRKELLACSRCLQIAISGKRGPSHNGSRQCLTNDSIRSGGSKAHCDCEVCFGGKR